MKLLLSRLAGELLNCIAIAGAALLLIFVIWFTVAFLWRIWTDISEPTHIFAVLVIAVMAFGYYLKTKRY
jgi:hypothetical protein